jgi:hypothetical protein
MYLNRLAKSEIALAPNPATHGYREVPFPTHDGVGNDWCARVGGCLV